VEKVLELHSLHRGRIREIQTFGCFVSVPGYRQDGMVHISQVANQRVRQSSVSDDQQPFCLSYCRP
jgi:predicted RNA-binding protein with RPS1 domain